MVTIPTPPSTAPTGTGFDQLVDTVLTDPGLAGRISGIDIEAGAQAAAMMNSILVEAISMTGAGTSGTFTTGDVISINQYIRSYYLATWQELHGNDEDNEETGYHLVQNDGAYWKYRGDNLMDTVADGIYHLGFEIQGDNILNEDGNPNASIQQLAEWLTQFYTDHSTTGTGLDRITDMVMADKGLDRTISDAEIASGADAANQMNGILEEAIQYTGANSDLHISVDDIRAINQYIRDNYLDEWATLHGDDEADEETGYHLVQNDGASTKMFGNNFVNTVADGIYHLGFEIRGCNILNEDGNTNASLSNLADWIQYFYTDQSTTGTGLDYLTDTVKIDSGLAKYTAAADINAGADAANALNGILVEAIQTTGVANDANISTDDIRIINSYIRTYHLDEWTTLHGDDENDEETGYHLVQNDGANIQFRGDNLIDTVADGIYHLGFEIQDERVLNEDGNPNATLADLATWLNYFYLDSEIIYGTNDSETTCGLNHSETFYVQDGDDQVYADAGDDQLYGGNGNDTLCGQDGNDTIDGGTGDDCICGGSGDDAISDTEGNTTVYGGDGDDTVSTTAGQSKLFGENGDDALTSGNGNDKLSGGDGDDALSAGEGNDELCGDKGNDTIDGGEGDDTLSGGYGSDLMFAGEGNDKIYGDNGNDTIDGSAGNDFICAGNGDDMISDTLGNNTVYGGDGGDSIITGDGSDSICGDSGSDTIVAGGGNDTISGGYGLDTILAGDGDDLVYGHNDNDSIDGGAGNDFICAGNGNDVISDTLGNNTVYGGDGGDSIITGDGSDSICGDSGSDTIVAAGGNDTISGGYGLDTILAGDGDDLVYGHNDNDSIDGGAGNDFISGGNGGDRIDAGTGDDQVYGGNHDDLMRGKDGNDQLKGECGNDILSGDDGNDVLSGGYSLDLLIGGNGNDIINGDDDNDILIDGYGADTYYGGYGKDLIISFRDESDDTLYGGKDADTFVFIPGEDGTSIGNDIIRDFSTKQHDRIEVGGADTSISMTHFDTDGNGKSDATLIQLSDSNGISLGSITVTGNLLSSAAITLTGVVSYENVLIPEGVEF